MNIHWTALNPSQLQVSFLFFIQFMYKLLHERPGCYWLYRLFALCPVLERSIFVNKVNACQRNRQKNHYFNLKKKFTFLCGLSITERLSKGTKIAIGASVISMVVALVGVTMGILYCRRKEYSGHRPTLMDDIDAQDDYRLWAVQIWDELIFTHIGFTSIKSHLEQGQRGGGSTLLLQFGDFKRALNIHCDPIL